MRLSGAWWSRWKASARVALVAPPRGVNFVGHQKISSGLDCSPASRMGIQKKVKAQLYFGFKR